MFRNISLVLAGAALAAAVIVACGDDGVGPADAQDAAGCDCPAADPPLEGRIVRFEQTDTSSAATIGTGATCPAGTVLLGGGCEVSVDTQNAETLQLYQSGRSVDGATYGCAWRNLDAITAEIRGWVTCLTLAP